MLRRSRAADKDLGQKEGDCPRDDKNDEDVGAKDEGSSGEDTAVEEEHTEFDEAVADLFNDGENIIDLKVDLSPLSVRISRLNTDNSFSTPTLARSRAPGGFLT